MQTKDILQRRLLKVLLVEDDEDDRVIFKDLLSEIPVWRVELDWVATYDEALEKKEQGQYDVCFLDYQLGRGNGIELLREFLTNGFRAPIIFLTGKGDHDLDVQAMEEGASDYLEKSALDANILERSIRYAINRTGVLEDLRRSETRVREMSAKLIDAQEQERKLISKELHDSIGANLAAVKFKLEEIMEGLGDKDISEKEKLEQPISMLKETIVETRRICSDLRPSVLDHLGILSTIRWLCGESQKWYPGIRIETSLKAREEDIPEQIKIGMFRILQEALNNIAKHSDADTIHLELVRRDDTIMLSIRDNGRGFDLKEIADRDSRMSGIGLSSMRERAELQGGSFSVLSSKGRGTTVRSSWPCKG